MRVLQVDSGREWRGGQNQARLLAREVARAQVDQRLVTCRSGELALRARADGVSVIEVPWDISLDPRALLALRGEIARFQPDVIHAHDSHALQLALWARTLGASRAVLVATRRVDFHLRRRSAWFHVDRVIAISEAVRGILVSDGIAPSVITVIPSGIDPDEVVRAARQPFDIRRRLALAPDTPLAVNVAALVDHKDQRTLVRAAAAARTGSPDLHWVVAGEGELRPVLEREIARLGLTDRVHLIGHIAEADALIREANVFVMSSKEEGLGSVVLDALALGKPVVATRGGGLPEIVAPEWVVPVGDAPALAAKVVAALGSGTFSRLPERFTASAMSASVLALYRSLI